MSKTTLDQAAAHMAPGLGRQWPRNKYELYNKVNDLRSFLYASPHFSHMFQDAMFLVRISRFYPANMPGFCGFSLWPGVASVAQSWSYGGENLVRSSFRANYLGVMPEGNELGGVVEVNGFFCTERDMPAASQLYVKSDCAEDKGVVIKITGVLVTGQHRSVELTLNPEGFAVSADIFVSITAVSMTEHLGTITLSCVCPGYADESYALSYYAPHELVPALRRYAVPSVCTSGCTLLLRVSLEYTPLHNPLDVVEFGDPSFLHAGARYLRYRDATAPDEQRLAAEALKDLKSFATGMRERASTGATRQKKDVSVFQQSPLRARQSYRLRTS